MKNYKKIKKTTFWISTLLWMGTCLTLILIGFISNFKESTEAEIIAEGTNDLSSKFTAVFGSLLISFAIGTVVVIFLRNKCRNTIWMVNLVLSVYLYGVTGMWIILAIWCFDELVMNPLYKWSKAKCFILDTVNE